VSATLRKYVVTTQSDPEAAKPIDLVERRFFADAPNRLWVADLTYIPTGSGWLYLAMVLDVYSRKIVGWAMDTNMRTELILDAPQMAVFEWIEGWYNPHRRHFGLGDRSPVDYEWAHHQARARMAELLPPAAADSLSGKIGKAASRQDHRTKTLTCPRKRGSFSLRETAAAPWRRRPVRRILRCGTNPPGRGFDRVPAGRPGRSSGAV
jgi:Integrase core domain